MAEVTPPLEIGIREERVSPDTAAVSVSGQIDLYTAPEFKLATMRAIEGGVNRLVIDLTETTFMDSTGLGVLIGAMKRLRPLGGSVVIVCPDAGIQRLFEISGLTHLFAIYETRSEIPSEH